MNLETSHNKTILLDLKYQDNITQMMLDGSRQESMMRLEYEKEISILNDRLKSEYKKQQHMMSSSETKHQDTISSLRAEHEKEMSELNNRIESEYKEHQTLMFSRETGQKDVISSLHAQYNNKLTTIQKQVDTNLTECDNKISKCQNISKTAGKEYQSKLTAYNTEHTEHTTRLTILSSEYQENITKCDNRVLACENKRRSDQTLTEEVIHNERDNMIVKMEERHSDQMSTILGTLSRADISERDRIDEVLYIENPKMYISQPHVRQKLADGKFVLSKLRDLTENKFDSSENKVYAIQKIIDDIDEYWNNHWFLITQTGNPTSWFDDREEMFTFCLLTDIEDLRSILKDDSSSDFHKVVDIFDHIDVHI